MGASTNPILRASSITGMLMFGTLTVVIQKIIFNMEGEGRDGDVHKFEKPWFQTEVMFIGMFGCLGVYEAMNIYKYIKAKQEGPAGRGLLEGDVQQKKSSVPKWKQYVLVLLPAMCDMIATAMMNIGLLWINASVWQMLRGSMVIFSAVFSKFFLKRELHLSHWIGVVTVAFALTVVAFSSLMPGHEAAAAASTAVTHSSEETISTTLQVIGCSLVIFAQVIQASQIVIEEFLLHEVDLHAVLIVGLEGMWGGIVCSLLLVLVCWFPGKAKEDSLDTLIMLYKNPKILLTGVAYATAILCYNLFGMYVTQTTSAVIRTILEGLRCACIWAANLFIFYVVMKADPNSKFGEKWSNWSYLQFCGFLFLLLGMFIYNSILRIDGLYYAPKKQAPVAEPTPAQEQSEQK